jgi:hypothetical protein
MSVTKYAGFVVIGPDDEIRALPAWLTKMMFDRAMRIKRLRNKVKAAYQTHKRRKITWRGVYADENA